MHDVFVLVLTLATLLTVVSGFTPTTRDLIKGYCQLVEGYEFHRTYKLNELCELYVRQYQDKVLLQVLNKL